MRKRLYLIPVLLLVFLAMNGLATASEAPGNGAKPVRFATFNASLTRSFAPGTPGSLVDNLSLSTPSDAQAQAVAEIIQRTRPDILLLNEIDYDELGAGGTSLAVQLFQDNYL